MTPRQLLNYLLGSCSDVVEEISVSSIKVEKHKDEKGIEREEITYEFRCVFTQSKIEGTRLK